MCVNRVFKNLTIGILLVSLTGCAALSSTAPLRVPVGGGFYSLQWQWPNEPVQVWQKVSWSQNAEQTKSREFIVSALFESQRLLLVALSPLGNELFRSELSATGHTFTGSDFLNDPKLALQVWADLQLSLWPRETVSSHLSNVILTQTPKQRKLLDNEKVVWSSRVKINTGGKVENKLRDYELTVNTLQYEVLGNDEN